MGDDLYYLRRDQYAEDDSGIFGTFYNGEELLCDTFELPWRDNRVEQSCIPMGEYECEIVYTKKFGRVILVKDVPGRTDILFHVGNTATDTRGCILVGQYRKYAGVRGSKMAMGFLLIDLPDKFKLIISGLQ